MKPVYSFFLIIFFCLSQFNKSQAINLSDYSKEEQKQYKEIKKMKKMELAVKIGLIKNIGSKIRKIFITI